MNTYSSDADAALRDVSKANRQRLIAKMRRRLVP